MTRTLREAARAAGRARDYTGAERLLSRAHLEGADGDRTELLAELGSAEARAGNPDGLMHLEAAVQAIEDPVRGAEVSIQLATALKFSIKVDRAADVLLEAIHRLDLPSSELGRRLYAELLGTRFIGPAVGERISNELASLPLPVGAPADRLDEFLLSAAAFDAAAGLQPACNDVPQGSRHRCPERPLEEDPCPSTRTSSWP